MPPPRFTTGDLKPGDVNFCYGSRDGQLWHILDRIYGLQLPFENTEEAIAIRKAFLKREKIGIFDIVEGAEREKVDASDLGLKRLQLRDLIQGLKEFPNVHTLLFTGGNSKNGPEYLFRKLIREYGIPMKRINSGTPRVHEFYLGENRAIRTVSLTAPSGSANRAVGSMKEYRQRKENDPAYTTIDFRVDQYRPFFLDPDT